MKGTCINTHKNSQYNTILVTHQQKKKKEKNEVKKEKKFTKLLVLFFQQKFSTCDSMVSQKKWKKTKLLEYN